MHIPTKRQHPGAFYALAVLILLAALALRVTALTRLPVSVDEDTHIYWTYQVVAGEFFTGFQHQKLLYTLALAALQPGGPESLWLGRIVSVLGGVVTTAAAIALGRLLARRAGGERIGIVTGLAAGLIYAALPLAVFHERLALIDPLLATFTGLATLIMVRLARRPRLTTAALLTLALAGALLTKASAVPYLVFPPLAALLIARRRDLPRALALAALAGGAVWLIYQQVTDLALRSGIYPQPQFRPSLDNLLLADGQSPGAVLAVVRSNAADVVEGFAYYAGVVGLALAALGLLWLLWGRARREALFLAASSGAFLSALMLSEQVTGYHFIPPRYLLPPALVVVALAACGLAALSSLLARLSKAAAPTAWAALLPAALLAAVLLPALRFDAWLIHDPQHVPLSPIDERQYREGFDFESLRAVSERLVTIWEAQGQPHVRVMGNGGYIGAVNVHVGPRIADFEDLTSDAVDPRPLLARWLASGEPVYLLDDKDRLALVELEGAVYESLGVYGEWELLRITGARGELADAVYASRVDPPEGMPAEHAELARALAGLPRPQRVVVYPASHAPELARRSGLPVTGLRIDAWPLTPQGAAAAVRALAPGEDGELVDVVIVDGERSDPDDVVALAFQRVLYHTGSEGLAGRFHWRRYVSGPGDAPGAPLHAEFEGVIDLDGEVTNPQIGPGEAVCLALTWQTTEPVQDSFHVFAHVVDGSGGLVAQHDAVPGDGLLPMTGWLPGQPVADHLAIPLPPGTPPGTYEVQVGIYDLASGLRLRVTGGEETGPDYAVLGRVVVP